MRNKNHLTNGNINDWSDSNTGVEGLKHRWHALPKTKASHKFLVTLNGLDHRYVVMDVSELKSQKVCARGFLFGPNDGARVELFYDLKKIVAHDGCADEIDYQLYRDDELIEFNVSISKS